MLVPSNVFQIHAGFSRRGFIPYNRAPARRRHVEDIELVEYPIGGSEKSQKSFIQRTMRIEEVAACLMQHGCSDITSDLDLACCAQKPFTRGGYGAIYKGVLKDGRVVAIKVVDALSRKERPDSDWKAIKGAAKELYAWSKSNHPGVLQLLGLAWFDGNIAIVSPLMQEGSIKQYLLKYVSANRFQFCLELVESLEYLHSRGVVHGDIKPDNIFMTDQGHPLLGDFGSALLQGNPSLAFSQTTTVGFTPRFGAPELLDGTVRACTFKADIYALGMTILCIMSGKLPYPDKGDYAIIYEVTIKKNLPTRPEFGHHLVNGKAQDKLWGLLEWSWTYEPKDRPTALDMKNQFMDIEHIIGTDHERTPDTSRMLNTRRIDKQ